MPIDRRVFLHRSAQALGLLGVGCTTERLISPHVTPGLPRLSARPGDGPWFKLDSGLHDVMLGGTRLLAYLPASARGRGRVPLVVFLHGASGVAAPFLEAHRAAADAHGVMVIAPHAVAYEWDLMQAGRFDHDIAGLDVVLQWVFHHVPIDARSVTLCGFSDGASYALAVGRANGDLFRRLVAYAPGALYDVVPVGRPPVLVVHGGADSIIPYGVSSTYIVPTLTEAGYEVELRGFAGGHAVPIDEMEDVVREARARAR